MNEAEAQNHPPQRQQRQQMPHMCQMSYLSQTAQTPQTAGWKKKKRNKNNRRWFNKKRHLPYQREGQDAHAAAKALPATADSHSGARVEKDVVAAAAAMTPAPEAGTWSGMFRSTLGGFVYELVPTTMGTLPM
ncbi:hypothetical protein CTA1_5268 [Colletotrichum tanaceti]|uniref:Uncharacterized protein n=1 Tax=Colletotrichum tanaceti TaxID=1306861 RepID=A0A4U6XMX5_9PEZI|nr:hypothetical protein CTA1_5268 [Colletotrichum tanaceti]